MTSLRFCRASQKHSLLLLAPADASLVQFKGKITNSYSWHEQLLSQVQRLRGRIYSEDGAIGKESLTADGRHESPVDVESWHLLTLNAHGSVLACTRFRQHSRSAEFHDLCLRNSALAKCGVWGTKLKASVMSDLSNARKLGFNYVEVGGWALDHEMRGTSEALQSVLSIFAWSQAVGGAIGISTATERNSSAAILKRLGGSPVYWDGCALPAYYDENYKCGMEILRFDSREPSPRYASSIDALKTRIASIEVVRAAPAVMPCPRISFGLQDLIPGHWQEPLALAS